VTSPLAAAEAMIRADRAHDDAAIWITRLADDAIRAQARTLEAEGPQNRPLWGIPVAVKDNIDVAGLPTTAACEAFAYTPEHDAACVARLRAAGANIVGKTNLDQFATGLVGIRSPYGTPRNPFDATRVPGGSSSGSGVAVAAGIVPLALGTDTAGSGRVPAMFGNIVGLKPTLGSIPFQGVIPACRSLDTVSIFATSVDLALLAARIMAGTDATEPYGRTAPYPHLRRGALPALRLACIAPDGCTPEIATAYRTLCTRLGAGQVDIAPFLQLAKLLYNGPWVAERSAGLRDILTQNPDALLPTTRAILTDGLDRAAIDAWDAFHFQADIRAQAHRLFQTIDALLLPTAPGTPTLAELAADPIGPNSWLGSYTNFVNLCDLAGWAIPMGFAGDPPAGSTGSLPAGVTLLGPAWSEGRLAALADAIHRTATTHIGATDTPLPPAAPPDPAAPDETPLFCIGAHMAGLPLNGALTKRGGRFLRVAKTLPEYRFFDLGTRPGLLRTPGQGGAIAGEVWALPTTEIGAILAEVPPPLGFGTVLLQDGPCLGFLAEPSGVADAPDVTAIGDWHAVLAARTTSPGV
jgi:allophanate hydrolase